MAEQAEFCPVCESFLLDSLYATRDVLTGEKIYRCRGCYSQLIKTEYGWRKA